MKSQGKFKDIDQYIALQPVSIQKKLKDLRSAIRSVAPSAKEVISYNMPAFKLNNVLVYFAACKNHIGFYPTGTGVAAFEKELGELKYSKGAIQFPVDEPLPMSLVKRIVKFRVKFDKETVKVKAAIMKTKK